MRLIKYALLLGSETAGKAYQRDVLGTTPLGYWALNEGSGTSIVDSSGNSYNGTYNSVSWDGTLSRVNEPVPYWNSANGDVYSAGLASAIDLDEGAMLIWVKVDASFWTDGSNHYFMSFWYDVSNRVQIIKLSTNNTIQFRRVGAGTSKAVNVGSLSYTDWFSVMLSWSVANDELKAYINGSQVGLTQTGNISAVGSLASATSQIGALNTSSTDSHTGYLADAVLWDAPVDADMIALGEV